jgi:SAM-dependent methyltransferase
MTECTVCETLARASTPTMKALGLKRPYGALVGDFLAGMGMLGPGSRILELGCGYGSLMAGLIEAHGSLVGRAVMMDLSLHLAGKQRERLEGCRAGVSHVMADIHELPVAKGAFDLAIVNEVIGDLDTATGLDPAGLPPQISSLVDTYRLEVPKKGPFNLNLGAIRLVETLCRLGIPAFITEHASDPAASPSMPYLLEGLCTDAFPRRIGLAGHDEYTIRFSHLEKVARAHRRAVSTGPLSDVLALEPRPSWRFIYTAGACSTDTQALLLEFLCHVRGYRWLVMR